MADYLQKAKQAAERKLAEKNGAARPARSQDRAPPEAKPSGKPAAVVRPLLSYAAFPLDALPRPLAGFVAEAAAALGCDPSMVALPAIAVAGSLIGNTRTIRLKSSWQEPCIFWTCIVADSGTLKSPAHDTAVRPLHRLQKRLKTDHAARMAEYQTAHEEWKSRKARDAANAGPEPEKPILPRVVCSDITLERLGELLEQNPRGILCARDELAGWFGSFSRYKGKAGASDLPAWLEMHCAGPLTIDRKTSEKKVLFIDRAAVSVSGTIQPGILAKAVRGDFLDSGFIARILLAMPPKARKEWQDVDIDPATVDAYGQLIESLYQLDFGTDGNGERVPVSLDLDGEARQAWIDFYNTFGTEQADADGERAAALSKLEGYAARFALLHHICERIGAGLDERVSIGAESIAAGIKLARWFANEAERIYAMFGETEKQRETRRLIEWIMGRGGEATVRNVQDNLRSRYPTAEAARAALDELAAAGIGEWVPGTSGPQGGRPLNLFRLCARKTGFAGGFAGAADMQKHLENKANGRVSRFCGFAGAEPNNRETFREPGEEG